MNIQEIKARLAVLDSERWKNVTEETQLKSDLETLQVAELLESKALAAFEWKYDYTLSDDIHLWAKGESYPACLDNLLEYEHDSVRASEDIEIGWSDGQPFIRGNAAAMRDFVLQNELVVDYSDISNKIAKLAEEIDNYEKFLNLVTKGE